MHSRAPRAREYCDRVPRSRPTDRFSLGFGSLHAMTLGKVSILCNLWKDILLNTFARIEVEFWKKKERSAVSSSGMFFWENCR